MIWITQLQTITPWKNAHIVELLYSVTTHPDDGQQ